MKNNTLLIALTLLALTFAGCSKHSPTAAAKNFDFGVVEVSGGKPSSQILPDGRTCTITAAVLPGGNVNLTATLTATNASGAKELSRSVQVPGVADQPYTINIADDTIITVKLHL